jgi:hypothetical protein
MSGSGLDKSPPRSLVSVQFARMKFDTKDNALASLDTLHRMVATDMVSIERIVSGGMGLTVNVQEKKP